MTERRGDGCRNIERRGVVLLFFCLVDGRWEKGIRRKRMTTKGESINGRGGPRKEIYWLDWTAELKQGSSDRGRDGRHATQKERRAKERLEKDRQSLAWPEQQRKGPPSKGKERAMAAWKCSQSAKCSCSAACRMRLLRCVTEQQWSRRLKSKYPRAAHGRKEYLHLHFHAQSHFHFHMDGP